MKRIGNVYSQICSIENLQLADIKARKGKLKQPGIRRFDKNRDSNLLELRESLVNKTYKISEYKLFKIYEPKERNISMLPYPDRIVQHAILNPLESVFVSMFTADSYSCIKGRGVHAAGGAVKKALRDVPGTQYCLKLDIQKFYPSIDHDILKRLLRRKIKDKDLLQLLGGIIDSAPGVPIGNYLSQYFANFFLTGFDHWLKEVKRVRYYFRYADDMVILSDGKEYLHKLLEDIRAYLSDELKLSVKSNYQVFPVAARGIDFVGYVYYHTHTRVRKSIKQRYVRMMKRRRNAASMASYHGWLKHGDCKNLRKTTTRARIQRLTNKRRAERFRRRKDRDKQNSQQGDRNP